MRLLASPDPNTSIPEGHDQCFRACGSEPNLHDTGAILTMTRECFGALSYDQYSHGLDSHGLYSHGLYGYGLCNYVVMAYIGMACIVMAY